MTEPLLAKQFVDVRKGTIAYRAAGPPDAPPVLFLHGIPTSSYLWRGVMRALEGEFRCLAPDLMGLGDTIVDPAGTDFSMPSQAEMLEEFLDALAVEKAHVVAHDQGGAAGQILAATRGSRVDRLILTDCVCYDNWPVPAIARLQRLARLPFALELFGGLGLAEFIETRTPLSSFRRGVSDPSRLPNEAIAEYLRPLRGGREARERFRRFLLAGRSRYTMAVLPRLREFRHPTLILWAENDCYIPPSWGRRLYEDIPGAERFEVIAGAGHFWPEEKPDEFAARIGEFLRERPAQAVAEGGRADEKGTALVAAERLSRKCPAPKGPKGRTKNDRS